MLPHPPTGQCPWLPKAILWKASLKMTADTKNRATSILPTLFQTLSSCLDPLPLIIRTKTTPTRSFGSGRSWCLAYLPDLLLLLLPGKHWQLLSTTTLGILDLVLFGEFCKSVAWTKLPSRTDVNLVSQCDFPLLNVGPNPGDGCARIYRTLISPKILLKAPWVILYCWVRN